MQVGVRFQTAGFLMCLENDLQLLFFLWPLPRGWVYRHKGFLTWLLTVLTPQRITQFVLSKGAKSHLLTTGVHALGKLVSHHRHISNHL